MLWTSVLKAAPQQLRLRTRREIAEHSLCLELSPQRLRVAIEAARVTGWVKDGSLGALEAALDSATRGAIELALVPLDDVAKLAGDASYSFDSFIASPSNQKALGLASEFAKGRLASVTSLFVHGPQNSGKSHLLRAIATEIERARPLGDVVLRGAEELSLELIGAIWNNRLGDFRAELAGASALLIDDVHALAGRQATQDELVQVLERLVDAPVVFSASEPVESMPDLTETLREQLRSAAPLELVAPEWETRVAIILDRVQQWGVEVEPEVASFLASKLGSDLQRVETVLTRLLLHPSCRNGLSNLDVVRHLLEDSSRGPIKVAPEEVVSTVARHFNLRQRDLRSSSRSQRIARPRQIAMYLVRQHCALSYPEIGRRFGRHHTTALHSVRLIRRRLDESGSLRTAVALLEKELLRRSEERG
ncbi:MAG: DnaA/Hda family protein [Myxococcota bacterium]